MFAPSLDHTPIERNKSEIDQPLEPLEASGCLKRRLTIVIAKLGGGKLVLRRNIQCHGFQKNFNRHVPRGQIRWWRTIKTQLATV